MEIKPIAIIHTDFPTKFGVPRQSGLVDSLLATIVFEPEYRDKNAVRGMEAFSHLWLIWHFSMAERAHWSPTVRPPRLGGNTRMGVFATRSPFRPNPIGLSCVKLEEIRFDTPDAPLLVVRGADLVDGTPIFDIKPYLPLSDCQPTATGSFATSVADYALSVDFPPSLLERIPEEKRDALISALEQDPRPGYRHADDGRIFGFPFANFEIRFTVSNGILTVISVDKE